MFIFFCTDVFSIGKYRYDWISIIYAFTVVVGVFFFFRLRIERSVDVKKKRRYEGNSEKLCRSL